MHDFHKRLLDIVRKHDDMTMRQACILLGCMGPSRTVRDLADELGVAKPAITRGVDRLVAFELAKRKEDAKDRRSILIELTAAGRKMGAVMLG